MYIEVAFLLPRPTCSSTASKIFSVTMPSSSKALAATLFLTFVRPMSTCSVPT